MNTRSLSCHECRTHYEGRGRNPRCPFCGATYTGSLAGGPPNSARAAPAPQLLIDADGWDYLRGAGLSICGAWLLYAGLMSSATYLALLGLLAGACGLLTLNAAIAGYTSTFAGFFYVVPKMILTNALDGPRVMVRMLALVGAASSCSATF